MKVLIGVDGSQHSAAAVKFVSSLMAPDKDLIAFCFALPQNHIPWAASIDTRARQEISTAIFEAARANLPEPLRNNVELIVEQRDPRSGLLTAAADWQADLIVVGARGIGPIQRLLLGSVSRAVLDLASVPVLVVRDTSKVLADSSFQVLLAHDGSEFGGEEAQLLNQFTWPEGTTGRLMTVMEAMFPGEVPQWLERRVLDAECEAVARRWLAEHEQQREVKYERMVRYQAQLPAPFHGLNPIVAEGNPAEQILKMAESQNDRLIVVGRRRLRMASRWLLGSTSQAVLSHAPCSVLVLPQRDE